MAAVGTEIVEFVEEVSGLYFRSVLLAKKGDVVHQHLHDHDHATYCGSGRAAVVIDGVRGADLEAGRAMHVAAGKQHEFIALEDGTRLSCVHDVASAESIKQREKV